MLQRLGARLSSFPAEFPELLAAYCSQIADAIQKKSHHDHRRALLIDFLRKTFDIEVDEIELEKKVKAAEARGRIDAFYKYVIVEVKTDLDSERADAMRELKKYFESRSSPSDYVAAVTNGVTVEHLDTILRPLQTGVPQKVWQNRLRNAENDGTTVQAARWLSTIRYVLRPRLQQGFGHRSEESTLLQRQVVRRHRRWKTNSDRNPLDNVGRRSAEEESHARTSRAFALQR
jgi:hypothetical protein